MKPDNDKLTWQEAVLMTASFLSLAASVIALSNSAA